MTVAELIVALQKLETVDGQCEMTVVIRDLNGLDWELEPDMLVPESSGAYQLVINSENINRLPPPTAA